MFGMVPMKKKHGTDVTRQKPILRLPVIDIPSCSSRLGGKSILGRMQPFASSAMAGKLRFLAYRNHESLTNALSGYELAR